MWIIGGINITIGENVTISCFSDLNVQRLEWVFGNVVVTNSSSKQVDLTFNPVLEYLHNREYICRGVTSYGTLERRITVTVHSEFNKANYCITKKGKIFIDFVFLEMNKGIFNGSDFNFAKKISPMAFMITAFMNDFFPITLLQFQQQLYLCLFYPWVTQLLETCTIFHAPHHFRKGSRAHQSLPG